jgi:bifunctional non-homologous end joining protein LigD
MLCALVDEPFNDPNWIFEPKLDGLRVICRFDGREWLLLSRNGKPQNFILPEIVEGLKRAVTKPILLDGEVVCLDENGQSSFRLLQQRFHLIDTAEVQRRMRRFPAKLFLFDVLFLEDQDVRDLTLAERKRLLKRAVRWKDPIHNTPAVRGKGIELFKKTCAGHGEGIIAKRLDSRYTGDRSGAWLKIKCSGRQEFVIGGFTEPQRSRVGLGALLVGYYESDGKTLRYAGKVGTGFTNDVLLDLRKRLEPLIINHSAFVNERDVPRRGEVHFVKPALVGEIAFAEWTQNDLLRQPRFQGLREDKKPTQVRRERPKHIR